MRRLAGWLGLLALLAAFSTPASAYTIRIPEFPQLEIQLRLTPLQKAQFDIAVEASQRALMSAAIAGLQVKERLTNELNKPIPDISALYRLHEEAIEMAAPSFREAGAEWERLFRMLDRRQIEAAKRFLRENLGPYSYGMI
jgi:hypothetical protein